MPKCQLGLGQMKRFSVANNQLTGTARIKREKVYSHYQQQIEANYQLKKEIV